MYPSAEVNHLDFYSSNHILISVSLKEGCDILFRKGPKRFMFEYKWMMEDDFNLIMEKWLQHENILDLPIKLSQWSS